MVAKKTKTLFILFLLRNMISDNSTLNVPLQVPLGAIASSPPITTPLHLTNEVFLTPRKCFTRCFNWSCQEYFKG